MPALAPSPAAVHAAAPAIPRSAAQPVAPEDATALDFALLLSQGLAGAVPGSPVPESDQAGAAADPGARGAAETLDLAALPPIPPSMATVRQEPADPRPDGGAEVAGIEADAAGRSGARVHSGLVPADASDTARPGAPAPQPFVLPEARPEATAAPPADGLVTAAEVAAPEASSTAQGVHAPASARAETPPLRIDAPVASPDWPEEMSHRVVWLVNRGEQTAALHLNPPDLGPVEVTVTLSGDQASASFVAREATVREALEAALPRLREMLAEAGFNLGQASVSAGSAGREDASGGGRGGRRGGPGTESGQPREADQGNAVIRRGRGLVDTFV